MLYVYKIGRERLTDKQKEMMGDNRRFRLAIVENGKDPIFYGQPGSVPKSVSRDHCEIEIDDNMVITITNVSGNNTMKVNGVECLKKRGVTLSDEVTLGKDDYPLKLEEIVKGVFAKQKYSIKHLEKIYEDNKKAKYDLEVKEKRMQNYRSAISILTIGSIALGSIPGLENLRSVFYPLAVILGIFFFVLYHKKAETGPLVRDRLADKFSDDYICPNPACGRFLGNQAYKNILKAGSCPYCKAKYFE